MQTLYFVLMVVCVGWLMIWAALPKAVLDRFWWPFTMKDDALAPPAETQAGSTGAPVAARSSSWRERAKRGLEKPLPASERTGRPTLGREGRAGGLPLARSRPRP